MLPFLQPKKLSASIVAKRKIDSKGTQTEQPAEEHSPEHIELAQQLISAVHAKDAEAVASVIKAIQGAEASEEQE